MSVNLSQEQLDNLMENKSKLEAILSAIGEGIIIIDLEKKIIFQNDKALEMFGDFVGRKCFSIYYRKDNPCENCPALFCIEHDTIKTSLHTRIDSSGNLHYYELTAAPVKENGQIIASVEVVREITERKLLEEELLRTTRRMQTVISKMSYGLLYTDRKDLVAIANDIALDFFSLKINDKLKSDGESGESAYKAALKNTINVFRGDPGVNYYESVVEKEGKWYNLGFSASRSSSGKYYGTIVNIIDITSLKKLEELKENLTNMIVHDMKHPMNTILYVLEMAAEDMIKGIDPVSKKLFEAAHKDSKILLNMIQEMLDISKMEEGEHILNKKETYYRNIIKNCVSEVSFLSQARGVNIKEIYDTERVIIDVDAEYFERIILNLFANAIKFAHEGSDILITATNHEEDGAKYMKISVANEGKDIPQAAQKTLFDKFKQAERRTSGKIAGTGLGLSFCKLAVEAHGGSIIVESPPAEFDSGAKFSFTLPA